MRLNMKNSVYTGSTVASGGLLAVMIFLNSELANFTSPALSSLIAHFIGILGSWILWKLMVKGGGLFPYSPKAPKWAYLGGAGGAFIVVFANITVNSTIGLIGSLSLMILGQTLFAILLDFKGWVGMTKRNLCLKDFLQVSLILTGSIFIIYN